MGRNLDRWSDIVIIELDEEAQDKGYSARSYIKCLPYSPDLKCSNDS